MKTVDTTYRTWLRCIVFTFLSVASVSEKLPAQNSDARYDIVKIKAAFVYNFIEFVTWPDRSGGPLVIGILGKDPFGGAFEQVEGRQVMGRKLTVKKSDRLEDLTDSWILFISDSEQTRVPEILRSVAVHPILTVSDMDRFADRGGMIQLYATNVNGDTKVRFDINKEAADAAGLKISFKLLSLSRPKP